MKLLLFAIIVYGVFSLNNQCLKCKLEVILAQKVETVINNKVVKWTDALVTEFCIKKKMFTPEICKGAVHEMGSVMIESVLYHYMDPDWVCPQLGQCQPVYETLDDNEAVQQIIQGKPDEGHWPPIGGNKKIRMLHMSDLHIDQLYKEGTNSDCGDPICCRESYGQGDAGYWGSLAACDLPQRTLQELFNYIKSDIIQEDELLYVFWTGDNSPHDIWKQSTQSNIDYTQRVTEMIKETFKGYTNIQFVPTLGNHEAFPVNNFDFTKRDKQLYDAVAEMWRDWIGDEAADHLKKYGYYKLEFGNWKIIAYDSQVCNPGNYYLIKDPTDPNDFLEWTYNELLESEKQDQAVYFAAHIFTSSCLPKWAMRFKALVDRFSRIVRGQIYGHAHGEFFNLYRGYTRNETLNAAYISTSVTTDSFKNPSFRIFEIDDDTKIPLNYHEYRLNLTKANEEQWSSLKWDYAFNFLEEYNVKSMYPEDVDEMANRIVTDDELADKLQFNMDAGYQRSKGNKQHLYCKMKSCLDDEYQICTKGRVEKKIYDELFQFLMGPWKKKVDNKE